MNYLIIFNLLNFSCDVCSLGLNVWDLGQLPPH